MKEEGKRERKIKGCRKGRMTDKMEVGRGRKRGKKE